MKIVFACIITLAVFLAFHIPFIKRKKDSVLAVYAIIMIMLFGTYNIRTIARIVPFYHPVDQTVYQLSFLSDGSYTDAFLDVFLKKKTVYTPNDAYDISKDDPSTLSLYDYYHANNMWSYLESNNTEIIKDDSLNGITLSSDQKKIFTCLGTANDLMRYTFPYSKYADKHGNGYFHYWYYSVYSRDSRLFICTEKIKDADDLVMIWETEDDDVTENYYLASREVFRSLSSLPQQQPVYE